MVSYRFFRSKLQAVSVLFGCFLFARVCPAGELPRELAPTAREPFAEQYVRERLALWQKRLQLQNWTISVVLAPQERLRPETLGNIKWDPKRKTAVIRVLGPAEYQKPFDIALKDMEFTIVHELIHLTLSPLPRNESSQSDEERAINQLANALLQHEQQN